MGKRLEQKLTRFDGGITTDIRTSDTRYSQLLVNFDAHSFLTKLLPFRDSEDGDSAGDTSRKQAFALALRSGTTYNLFALGLVSGAARAEVLMKTTGTGGTNDYGDNGWATPSNNQSSAGSTAFDLFVYYRRTGRIYGARAGTNLWAFDPTSSAAWDDSIDTLTYTEIGQGVVHSKDNNLYIPYYNNGGAANAKSFIRKYDGTTFSNGLTLPDNYIPRVVCEYGNYLAIGCESADLKGKSIVYLWDRDASLTTLSESIDWGTGRLRALENLDGTLIGISIVNETFHNKVVFRYYAGGYPEGRVFKELISLNTTTTSITLPIRQQKVDNRLYFLMTITLNGTQQQGLWKVGRVGNEYAVTFDRPVTNDTALSSGVLNNFFIDNDFVFISYVSSAAYDVSKTIDTETYSSTTSIWETVVLNGGDASKTKKIVAVGVMTEPLPTSGSPQVVLKYKKDDDSSFTTIFTHTTAGSLYHEAINIESSGATLPQNKEVTFRVESKGKAVITGLIYKYEFISDEPSD